MHAGYYALANGIGILVDIFKQRGYNGRYEQSALFVTIIISREIAIEENRLKRVIDELSVDEDTFDAFDYQ